MFLSYVENPDYNQISLKHLKKAIEQVVSLSQTMKKKIDGLREWALIKVRLASKKCSDECIVETASVEDKEKKLSKLNEKEKIF